MQFFKNFLLKFPPFFKLGLIFHRSKTALVNFSPDIFGPFKNFIFWLFTSNEISNYTYDLTNLNKSHLISFIALVTNKNEAEISQYIQEVENNKDLKKHIIKFTKKSSYRYYADLKPLYGRRLGWYALVRAIKPKVVVETGVDKGLGSCIISAALIKNHQEGYKGKYFGTDIDPNAGYLLQGKYAQNCTILYGDSIKSLIKFPYKIDLFINDSDHSAQYEKKEYETIKNKFDSKTIIISDNSHITGCLKVFARQTKRHFLFFKEDPVNHWYSGAGIGAAFNY